MAYHLEPNGDSKDIVWDGWENGIAPSPHKGIANMQAVNINTELGEVMCSYSRTQQSQVPATSQTGSRAGSSTLFAAGAFPVMAGSWISITGSSITGLSDGTYYVISNFGSQGTIFQISTTYSTDAASVVSGFSGSGSFTYTMLYGMTAAVQGATERYVDTTGTPQFRYYVLDTNGRVWVRDSITYATIGTPLWALPYTSTITSYNGSVTTVASGLAVYNGYVCIFGGNKIFFVSTAALGTAPAQFSGGTLLSSPTTTNSHQAFTGRQGRLYWPDGRFVGSLFADVSLDPDASVPTANIQSYCSYTASTTTGTVTAVLNGSLPTEATTGTPSRIPAFFFTAFGGTQPTNLTAGTKYYIQYVPGTWGTFQVYSASSGGAAINIATGAAGTQYFNTFMPFSSDGLDTLLFSPERLTLPAFEIGNVITELGNTAIVGTISNILYPWDQISPIPSDGLPMPESNVAWFVSVNNVIYIGAGNRGNIYITNASSVSLAISVPDYTSGLIEPYFVWGGAMYLRGRVYFGIQDQTSSHTGQCGGVWSFIPVQNFSYSQDIGMALRMDNKNSYNTFNGVVTVLIPNQDQRARSPQYWSAWTSSSTSPTYGIDYTNTDPSRAAVIQTDIAATGTILNKQTFSQVEYKLSAPLAANESVAVAYRTDLSQSFTSLGTFNTDADGLSGYIPVNFNRSQWVQLQATLTPNGDVSTSSFVRLTQLRLR